MKNSEKSNPYEDIIHLPRHVSDKYPQMPIAKRAAQFSPFAALSGHSAAIRDVTRLTEEKRMLGEDSKIILDRKLNILRERIKEQPQVTVTYFVPDTQKSGGEYVQHSGSIYKIDSYNAMLVMNDGTKIYFDDISDLSGEIIDCFF